MTLAIYRRVTAMKWIENVFRKKTQIKKPWYPFMRYGWYPIYNTSSN